MSKQGRLYRVRKFNRRLLNPLMLKFAGRRVFGVVHHQGRQSGREYMTPVVALPTDDGFLIPLTYGSDTDWCLNVQAAGEFTLEWRGTMNWLSAPEVTELSTLASVFPGWLWLAIRLSRTRQGLRAKRTSSGRK
jgi:deazaflavin-dependent oxidoreductase (nitroreductase family)